MMEWANPEWLPLMGVVALLGAWRWWSSRRQQAAALRFAVAESHERLSPPFHPGARAARALCWFVGLVLLVVALGRPRWGESVQSVQARGADILVLLDVSRSMLADDVVPSRLERAKADIRDLLAEVPGDRVGLIAFAGVASLQVPLTTDQGFLRMSLDALDTQTVSRGGSLIGDAIRKGLETLDEQVDRDQVLILITDGEDQDSFPVEAARLAAERRVRIFTVGLGNPTSGQRIPLPGGNGQTEFVEHEGREVRSRLDEDLLREIAATTNGAYVPAQTRDYDLGAIYRDRLSSLARGEISSDRKRRLQDRFHGFLLAGILLLAVESAIPRKRELRRVNRE